MPRAKIWTESDPWLTKRLEHGRLIEAGDLAITNAVMTAMQRWLDGVALAIYHRPQKTRVLTPAPAPAITADAGDANTSSGLPEGMLPDLSMWPAASSWQVLVDTVVTPEVSKLFGAAFIKATRDADINDLPYQQAYIATTSDRLSTNLWPQGVFNDAREVIADGIDEGLSIDHITENLREVLQVDHHAWQARRIARTETMSAVNAGTWNGASAYAELTGEAMFKQWYATADSRTREDHRTAHEQVRPMAEKFTVGGWAMDHPGDSDAPPSQVCNCRCTLLILSAAEAREWLNPEDWQDEPTAEPAALTATHHLPEPLESAVTATLTYGTGLKPPAAHSATKTAAPPPPAAGETEWWGVLAPMDTPSADGRMIAMPPLAAAGDENRDPTGNPTPRTRPLPLPLLYQDALSGGHDGAVPVGLITRAWIQDGMLYGCGVFDLEDPRAAEIARKIAAGHLGWISVDLDDTEMEYREGPGVGGDLGDGLTVAADWRLMSATLVSQPAFPTAKIVTGRPEDAAVEVDDAAGAHALADDDPAGGVERCDDPECEYCGDCSAHELLDPAKPPRMPGDRKHRPHDGAKGPACPNMAKTAAAVEASAGFSFKVLHPDTGLPVADAGRAWDGAAAAKRVADYAKNADGELDPAKYGKGFLYRADGEDPTNVTAYKLGYADVIDGRLTIVPRGVYAAAGALAGARTPLAVPDAQRKALMDATERLYGRVASATGDDSIKAPWVEDTKKAAVRTAVSFGRGRGRGEAEEFAPPLAWFQNPSFPSYMNVTVCDDGRIFGHLAPWNECHTGFTDRCYTAPKSPSGYSYFHQGTVRTAEGHDVAVGTIHMGGDHAGGRLSASDAQRHYADTTMAAAVVRAGEDAHGIWIAGAVLPQADVVTLRRAPWSGDWRRIGPAMELCGVLAVNQPGFPVPRPNWKTDDRGVVLALTAAAGTACARPDVPSGSSVMQQFARELASGVARELAGELAADKARARRFAAAQAQIERVGRTVRAERFERAMQAIQKGV